jgi:hypothetical protein
MWAELSLYKVWAELSLCQELRRVVAVPSPAARAVRGLLEVLPVLVEQRYGQPLHHRARQLGGHASMFEFAGWTRVLCEPTMAVTNSCYISRYF